MDGFKQGDRVLFVRLGRGATWVIGRFHSRATGDLEGMLYVQHVDVTDPLEVVPIPAALVLADTQANRDRMRQAVRIEGAIALAYERDRMARLTQALA